MAKESNQAIPLEVNSLHGKCGESDMETVEDLIWKRESDMFDVT
jgi:hypothetical protein